MDDHLHMDVLQAGGLGDGDHLILVQRVAVSIWDNFYLSFLSCVSRP